MKASPRYKIGSLIKPHSYVRMDGLEVQFGLILRFDESNNSYEIFIPDPFVKKWIDKNVLDCCFEVYFLH